MTNCPNCGSPISGVKCEYCGTAFFDLVDITVGEKCIVRLRYGGSIITGEMYVGTIDTEVKYADPIISRGCTGRLHYLKEAATPCVKMNMEFISLGKMTVKEVSDN